GRSSSEMQGAVALTPEKLVVVEQNVREVYPPRDESPFTIWLIDRTTGDKRQLHWGESVSGPVVSAARDTVFVASSSYVNDVAAFRVGSERPLWRLDTVQRLLGGDVSAFVPFSRKLLVVSHDTLALLAPQNV